MQGNTFFANWYALHPGSLEFYNCNMPPKVANWKVEQPTYFILRGGHLVDFVIHFSKWCVAGT